MLHQTHCIFSLHVFTSGFLSPNKQRLQGRQSHRPAEAHCRMSAHTLQVTDQIAKWSAVCQDKLKKLQSSLLGYNYSPPKSPSSLVVGLISILLFLLRLISFKSGDFGGVSMPADLIKQLCILCLIILLFNQCSYHL